jgi:hypothetical protein
VEGVDDHRGVRESGGHPAQEPALGGVRVHDGEALTPHQPDQPPQDGEIGRAQNVAEPTNLDAPDPSLARAGPQVSAGTAGDPHLEPGRIGAHRGQQRVAAGARPEPGDDVQHLDAVRLRLRGQVGRVDGGRRRRRPGRGHDVAISVIARSAATIAASPSATDVVGR